ncbi:MAG: gliding motility-associated ABC transporter substrate-binding protein GldG, partial [Bacteroidia bacterium]|nr:gliding motility-associated ABC transporter substrate-binding protein GldG [Bacteroidia bacterium]
IEGIEEPIIVDIFLDGDDFPSEFKRLQRETRFMLEEFASINSSVKFGFIDPLEDPDNREQNIRQLSARGLTPMELSVQESGRSSKAVIFPWALASYDGVTVKIPLVKNKMGSNQEELVNNSVQNLEYALANGFSKLLFPKRRTIAVLKGNGELPNRNIADFVTTLRDYYFIAPFTLDAVESVPQRTLDSLLNFDLIIAAKPTARFSEEEKYILDQYTMNGGKSLWLIDAVAMDKDSLLSGGSGIATPRDLNLTDFFFKYGIRLNPKLVSDLYSAPITLASGEGSQARFSQLPWFYSPLINPPDAHPITKNINLVKFDFPSPIDTLKNKLDQTILLNSSVLSRADGVPREITIETATKEPDPKDYSAGPFILSVLIEGKFTSVYKNRVKPLVLRENLDDGIDSKMIVAADGDLIRNDISNNRPLELGFDKWTGQLYGNKEFLLNAVNYLLDDNGLINIRSKNMSIGFLDQQKVAEDGGLWKILNLLVPLLALGLFGILFHYFRRKKYAL